MFFAHFLRREIAQSSREFQSWVGKFHLIVHGDRPASPQGSISLIFHKGTFTDEVVLHSGQDERLGIFSIFYNNILFDLFSL